MRGFALGVVLFILLLLSIVMGTVLASLAGTAKLQGQAIDAAQNRAGCVGISRMAAAAVNRSLLANSNQTVTQLASSLSPFASVYNPAAIAYPVFSYDELNTTQSFELIVRQMYPDPATTQPPHIELIGGSLFNIVAYRRSFAVETRGHPRTSGGFVCDQNHPCSTTCRAITSNVADAIDLSQFSVLADRALNTSLSAQANVKVNVPTPSTLPGQQTNEAFDLNGLSDFAPMSSVASPPAAAQAASIRIINGVWFFNDGSFPGRVMFSDHGPGSPTPAPLVPGVSTANLIPPTKDGTDRHFSKYDYLLTASTAQVVGEPGIVSYDVDANGDAQNRNPAAATRVGTLSPLNTVWHLPTMRFDVGAFATALAGGHLPNGAGGVVCAPGAPCTAPDSPFSGLIYIASIDGPTPASSVAADPPYELCEPAVCSSTGQSLSRILHVRKGGNLTTFQPTGLVIATNLGVAVEAQDLGATTPAGWNVTEVPHAIIGDRVAFLSAGAYTAAPADDRASYHGIFVSRTPGSAVRVEDVFGVIESPFPGGNAPRVFGALVVVGSAADATDLPEVPLGTSQINLNRMGTLAGPSLPLPYPMRIATTLNFAE